MNHKMTVDTPNRSNHFLLGLLAGTAVGAGLALWLAPNAASEIRDRVSGTARGMKRRATEGYEEVSGRVEGAVDDLNRAGQAIRNDAAESVARGAREVERMANA